MLYAESLADIRPTKMVIDIFRHLKDAGQYVNLDEIWDLPRCQSEIDNSLDVDTVFVSLQTPRDEPGELNDSSNGNMDQRSQIMDQHDLSDSDALPLLNPNEVIPLVLPIAPSYKESQTKGGTTEEKLSQIVGTVPNRRNSVKNQDSDKSVIVNEPITEEELIIKTEPIDPSSNGDENDSKESEDEQSDVNDRLTEDEVKEAEEENKKLLQEKLKQEVKVEIEQTQIKLEHEGQEDTGLLTPPEFRTPLSSPTNVADADVNASSVSPSMMVSPIKLLRLAQSESSQSPEHAVYRIKRDRRKKREPPMIIPPYQPQSTQSTNENDASSQYPKPPYSYSVLIMLALKNSYRGALRVCDIYSFICYHFPYFRTAPAGWKNSVRHNLSLNNRFEKVDDDDDDEGDGEPKNNTQKKGGLWRYAPDKTKKLVETMKSRSKKDPAGVTLSMSEPHMLEQLERGEMKFVVGNPNMEYIEEEGEYMDNDEEGTSDDNSMESMHSVTLEAEGLQNLLHEDEEEDIETEEHVETHYPLADNSQDESHEEENGGNANQIEVYGQVHATTLPHQVHLHLQEVSPIQKRRKVSNCEPVQNGPVVLQVQENTVRRRIAVRPSGSPSGPQAGPSRLQAGALGALASQPVTTTPQYVILNIDKSLL